MTRQRGNLMNASVVAISTALGTGDPDVLAPASIDVEAPAPVRKLNSATLQQMGGKYRALFDRFASERQPAEQKWLKNLRQYLGIYDPEILSKLNPNRSRAYPRLTRIKCAAMLSRLMNMMFPGNEDNWELNSSPSPSMSPEFVKQAVEAMMAEQQPGPDGQPAAITQDLIDSAVRRLAEKQAAQLTALVKDQLLELGGDQSLDWIALNRKVIDSGIKYGIGVLEGPYVREIQESGWAMVEGGQFQPVNRVTYKPQFDHLPVWDFYPDMSARNLPGEGYFVRKVLGRRALRKLATRPDFFEEQIKAVIAQVPGGNWRAKSWETELRALGNAINSDQGPTMASGREKYEIIIWKGPVSAQTLMECGATVPESMKADDIDAEIWMIDNFIIKADINAWHKLGVDVRQVHVFSFDEDDTSPIGQGLPGIVRDSQLSICAATRMTLDNASVTCGPNFEVNTTLMRSDQDLTAIEPYKIWYRDDDGLTAQFPAMRRIEIDGHLQELQGLIKLFLEFAEMETFIGPSTGGDFSKMPSEPMRTAAGASAVRGDAALPFKDIVRNFDTLTQSVIWSIVMFNRRLNPDLAPQGDYDVIPRGATSLVAKEVRGMQIDALSQTLTPDDMDHVDQRKWVEAKFSSRDLQGMLVSDDVAAQNASARAAIAAEDRKLQQDAMHAEIRKTLADAFKGVSQGQKNSAAADKTSVDAASTIIESQKNDQPQAANN